MHSSAENFSTEDILNDIRNRLRKGGNQAQTPAANHATSADISSELGSNIIDFNSVQRQLGTDTGSKSSESALDSQISGSMNQWEDPGQLSESNNRHSHASQDEIVNSNLQNTYNKFAAKQQFVPKPQEAEAESWKSHEAAPSNEITDYNQPTYEVKEESGVTAHGDSEIDSGKFYQEKQASQYTLEDIVYDAISPYVNSWLVENLETVAREVIKSEIKNVIPSVMRNIKGKARN